MKWFILPAGIWILIDKIDIPIIQSSSWRLNGWRYIQATSGRYKGKFLHKIIAKRMGLDVLKFTDHKDRNLLNNQRLNLREATKSQNMRNRKIHSNNKSGYKGVSWNKLMQKWQATILVNAKVIHLGYFDNPKDAYIAYCQAADQYFGEFARYD